MLVEEVSFKEASNLQGQIARPGSSNICTNFCKSDFLVYHQSRGQSELKTVFLSGSYENSDFVLPLSFSIAQPDKIVSHLGSPYAGVCIDSNQPEKIKDVYELCFEEVSEMFPSIASLEFRLPPSAVSEFTPLHEWALWSLGCTTAAMYLGRYFLPMSDLKFNRNRRRRMDKIEKSSMRITCMQVPSNEAYELLLTNRTKRHSVVPTHTMEDFVRIHECVPGMLSTYEISHSADICAVAIIFEDEKFATIQYLAGSNCSFDCGSQDLLVEKLMANFKSSNKILLFGTSTEPHQKHKTINAGLDNYKESFGALPYVSSRFTKVWN
jgi:hypothetical protein